MPFLVESYPYVRAHHIYLPFRFAVDIEDHGVDLALRAVTNGGLHLAVAARWVRAVAACHACRDG